MKRAYRYKLKGKIHSSGFRTLTEFSERINVDVSRLSRVCSGWEIPSPGLKEKMAKGLEITSQELKALL